ncbi:MAG: hypothetical protein V4564_05320 [Pseudomonadota bacterium]|uniref:hypothetical protein n=1 Tax=Sphingomonas sp. ERG5 TaxID=1381597 RepID=UPI00054B6C67|nr:hypothetical protein [Sphingomonas sp. ERG5]
MALNAAGRGLLFSLILMLASGSVVGQEPARRIDKAAVARLMARAVQAGRATAAAASVDSRLGPDDKRDAQGRFALILLRSGNCPAAATFIGQHEEVKAASIRVVMSGALSSRNRPCANDLAALMLERWDDRYYTPPGRIGARFVAAAVLDAAGRPDAWGIMRAAEAELLQFPDHSALWNDRFDALSAYEPGTTHTRYLEYLADRMLSETQAPTDSMKRGLFALFAFYDRCDLVARVMRKGAHSCDEAQANAEALYRKPSAAGANQLRRIADAIAEAPRPEEESLTAALGTPDAIVRLLRLTLLVTSCRAALDAQ